jgi:hypothetical protein
MNIKVSELARSEAFFHAHDLKYHRWPRHLEAGRLMKLEKGRADVRQDFDRQPRRDRVPRY